MALFQPTNITPSAFAGLGNGVVDVNDPISITWQVNGTSPMTAFEIEIYYLQSRDPYVIYNSGIINLDTPFYGTDERGNPQFYTYNSTSSWSELETGTDSIVNGSTYSFRITQYWGANNANSVVQYSPSVFVTRSKPTLTLNGFSGDMVMNATSPSVTVTATYSQAEGDAINWCRWIFVSDLGQDVSSVEDATVLEDTGEIYTGDLSYTYDGMINGYTYAIRCMVQTQSGVVVTTPFYYIDPAYQVENQTVSFSALIADDSAALIDIQSSTNIVGTPTPSDNYGSFQNGYLELAEGASVTWDKFTTGSLLSFDSPWYLTWRGILTADTSDIISVSCNGDVISLSFDGDKTISWRSAFLDREASFSFSFSQVGSECTLTISPTEIHLLVEIPGSFGYSGNIPLPDEYVQSIFNSVTLEPQTKTGFISLRTDSSRGYVFDEGTLLLTQFSSSTLTALSAQSAVGSISIYRYNNGVLSRLVQGDNVSLIRDFGVRSNQQYYYEMIQSLGNNKYSPVLVSNTICKQFSAYYLIEATEDADDPNVYHALKVWRFGNNIAAGSVSNNNSPTWLTNFTPYRFRQPISRMGKSGSLQALLSNFDPESMRYQDTVEMMDDLWAASTSNNVFFLKDMKGSLHMVHISSPIVQTVNTKSTVQQVSVSVPWEEVGDASSVSLIQLPTDAGWKANMLTQIAFDVDVETGMLVATYPKPYFGSTFRIEGNNLVMITKDGIPSGNIILSQIVDGNLIVNLAD